MAFKLQLPLLRTLQLQPSLPRHNPNHISLSSQHHHLRRRFFPPSLLTTTTLPPNLRLTASTTNRNGFATARVIRGQELTGEEDEARISEVYEEYRDEGMMRKELAEQSIWDQMKEIVMFTGPATGLWLCGPLMSLIDTAVIGQGSSIELAALVAELA